MKIIYSTVGSQSDAHRLAAGLVESRIAACVNIYPGVESVYLWKGEVSQDKEWALWIKAPDDMEGRVVSWLRDHHPYDTPCILSLEPSRIDEKFLAWVQNVARGQ